MKYSAPPKACMVKEIISIKTVNINENKNHFIFCQCTKFETNEEK
jgi:hypothetical protein